MLQPPSLREEIREMVTHRRCLQFFLSRRVAVTHQPTVYQIQFACEIKILWKHAAEWATFAMHVNM